MEDKLNVKGLIFDFGGTLDTGGNHWGEVLWEVYRHFDVPVAKDAFRKAYIHGERTLAMHPLIQPHFHFADVLRAKLRIQLGYLQEQGMLSASFAPREELAEAMAAYADGCTREVLARSARVLGRLRPKYSMVLVSNFYGNLHTVLQDAALLPLFDRVIESAVVGVRKPNPAIFALGVCACNLPVSETAVIGDSFDKDMKPARALGCRTIWLKGSQWEEPRDADSNPVDAVVTELEEIERCLEFI
ncbi:HAD family hydrolase [Bacteroides muris (ex Fokt et al. 2023)]|uniref:HAD family hydrolase n=1 Tax=Bacteroides muris (ex Fokt et al. 2023) TaxID=2937417 RepID=A0A9X2NT95_9BACE|nr:HAD family hydrolase [Bacteroides muris (ex Fokt et al. 2023)]MCR6504849.1 HAD family hydrolase [Bacteroides muris (ex Fokt et al. 2023)]